MSKFLPLKFYMISVLNSDCVQLYLKMSAILFLYTLVIDLSMRLIRVALEYFVNHKILLNFVMLLFMFAFRIFRKMY